jgi:hypothetical protein
MDVIRADYSDSNAENKYISELLMMELEMDIINRCLCEVCVGSTTILDSIKYNTHT